MAAPDLQTLEPWTLPRDMVRVMFPVDQPATALPALPELPGLVDRWNFGSAPGTPVTLSYAFSDAAPAYDPGANVADAASYAAFDAAEQANVETVLAEYAEVSGLTFQRVADAGSAQVVFRKVDLVAGVGGFAYFPPFGTEVAQHGDVFLDLDVATQPYSVFHELGHAFGLDHPYSDGHPHPEDYGFAGGRHLSVVDQRPLPRQRYVEVSGNQYTVTTLFDPAKPMPLDILALQMLYGRNDTTASGDTTYTFDVDPLLYDAIWDGAGNDTIDLSNQPHPNLVSLTPGSFSSIGLRDPFEGLPPSILDWIRVTLRYPESEFVDGSNMLAIAFDTLIENAIGGAAGDRLIGNSAGNRLEGGGGNDTLLAGDGNDTLVGDSGTDSMVGGSGNDNYFVDDARDLTVEVASAGTDIVVASVTWTLHAHTENLSLSGSALDGTGNNLNNVLTGNGQANHLRGFSGNDTLLGGAGVDTLDGGSGVDSMAGGTGNDFYWVDAGGDVVTEAALSGYDKVYVTLDWTMAAEVESLTLMGAAGLTGTGNPLANMMVGNTGANTFHGMDGNDTVYAGDGNDALFGGNGNDDLRGQVGNDSIEGDAGNDIVFGGAGVDTMVGSAGNDTYYVDVASDVVVEIAGEGDDKVVASIDWVLGAEFERLTLEGSAVNGTGNAAANTLSGSPGANRLLGLDGGDTIYGGAGADTLEGGNGADLLSGQDGNDTLTGGAGNDTLRGGNGADRFRFVTPAPGEGVDRIEDFSSAAGDKIAVVAANFGLVAGAAATLVVNGAPTTGTETFVYTSASGLLLFDADGNGGGAAVSLATLVGKPALTTDEILLEIGP